MSAKKIQNLNEECLLQFLSTPPAEQTTDIASTTGVIAAGMAFDDTLTQPTLPPTVRKKRAR